MMQKFVTTAAIATLLTLSSLSPALARDHSDFQITFGTDDHHDFDRGFSRHKWGRAWNYDEGREHRHVFYRPYIPQHYYYAPVRTFPIYVAPPAPPVYLASPVQSDGYCREFTQQVYVGNRFQQSYGTACLQPDGTWQVVQ